MATKKENNIVRGEKEYRVHGVTIELDKFKDFLPLIGEGIVKDISWKSVPLIASGMTAHEAAKEIYSQMCKLTPETFFGWLITERKVDPKTAVRNYILDLMDLTEDRDKLIEKATKKFDKNKKVTVDMIIEIVDILTPPVHLG